MGSVVIDNVFWAKIGFIVVVFAEAFFSGIFPTLSKSCRESPKILGIANSFAAGVFLAIALIHILPEEAENWESLNEGVDPLFPLPYLLMFLGYTLILIIDKVLFDTHSLFEEKGHGHGPTMDPAEAKLVTNVRASMMAMERQQNQEQDPAAARKSIVEAREDIGSAVQQYLSKEDRFATRLRASMSQSKASRSQAQNEIVDDQSQYFVENKM